MAYGLQVFDNSGGIVLDVSDRLTLFHSAYTVYVPATSTVIVPVAALVDDGTWTATIPSVLYDTVSLTLLVGGVSLTTSGGAVTVRLLVFRL